MLTKPSDLADREVAAAVESGWSLTIDHIEYFPAGYGSHHWKVLAEGSSWFVTVDALVPAAGSDSARLGAALQTARALADAGLTFVIAPIVPVAGDLLVPVDDRYVVSLFPFMEGTPGRWSDTPDHEGRLALCDRLVAIHTASVETSPEPPFDDFQIPARGDLEKLMAGRGPEPEGGPFSARVRRLLTMQAERLERQLSRYDGLALRVAGERPRFVITHGEPHPGNTILTSAGLVLVDWDTARLAPAERDLWWIAGGDATIAGYYEEQTGFRLDARHLEFYRLRWDLTDLALFAAQLAGPHVMSQDTRTAWTALVDALDHLEE